jgi:hypothetical protein
MQDAHIASIEIENGAFPMLYTGSYRPRTRAERTDSLLVALIFVATLLVLTLGATAVHFALNPHAAGVDFPPADWSTMPPNWTD